MEICGRGAASSASSSPTVADGGSSTTEVNSVTAPGLRAVVHVMPEDDEGTYAISLMRLVGDTFEFHNLYRQLRGRLSDITTVLPPSRSHSVQSSASRSAQSAADPAVGFSGARPDALSSFKP